MNILNLFQKEITREYYLREVVTSTAAAVTFSALIQAGQSLEIQMERLDNTINELSWYSFNKKNKLIYLIVKINSSKCSKIKFSENFAINYDLGLAVSGHFLKNIHCNYFKCFLQIVRNIYSAFSVLIRIT